MIHVVSERVSPIAAIEAGDTTPTTKKISAKRIFQAVGVTVAGTAVAALAVMHLNSVDSDATTEED
jgi:hypothetical protein